MSKAVFSHIGEISFHFSLENGIDETITGGHSVNFFAYSGIKESSIFGHQTFLCIHLTLFGAWYKASGAFYTSLTTSLTRQLIVHINDILIALFSLFCFIYFEN